MNDVPFTFSLENSVKGSTINSAQKKMNETNKSEVLEKITPEQIYEKLKRNKMLRWEYEANFRIKNKGIIKDRVYNLIFLLKSLKYSYRTLEICIL